MEDREGLGTPWEQHGSFVYALVSFIYALEDLGELTPLGEAREFHLCIEGFVYALKGGWRAVLWLYGFQIRIDFLNDN